MVKYLICGGGIAGLYTALQLLDKRIATGDEIIIVEKSNRLGGRIYTKEHNEIKYDAGATRIHKDHNLTMSLIYRYNLEKKLIIFPEKHKCRLVLNDRIVIPDMNEISKLLKKLTSIPLDESLYFKTLEQVSNEILGVEKTELIINAVGYNCMFYKTNAYNAIVSIKKIYSKPECEFYHLIDGLYQIVEGIRRELEEAGVRIILNLKLVDWNDSVAEFVDFDGNKSTYIYEKLILSLTQAALKTLTKLDKHFYYSLDSVMSSPTIKIVAKFPTSWFHDIPKTTTNLPIRVFVPFDVNNGFCWITYCNDELAKEWQDLAILGELEKNVMKYLRQLFPEKIIPDPEWIEHTYWVNSIHFWKPYFKSDTIYQKIIQPFDNIFICGESYSNNQSWIQGALKTSSDVVGRIANNTTREDREYTMEEVASSNNLTVIDGNVYNLFKMDWLDRHPGGPVIKKAVGKDATPMFKYINHPKYAKDILEELYVGKLKQSP